MIIDLNNLDDLENLTSILRIIVTTDIPYNGKVDYLLWEHRNITQWIHEFEIVNGEVNSQRYAKYNREGKLTNCISFN